MKRAAREGASRSRVRGYFRVPLARTWLLTTAGYGSLRGWWCIALAPILCCHPYNKEVKKYIIRYVNCRLRYIRADVITWSTTGWLRTWKWVIFVFQLLRLFHMLFLKNLHVKVAMLLVVFVNADFILNFYDITSASTMSMVYSFPSW